MRNNDPKGIQVLLRCCGRDQERADPNPIEDAQPVAPGAILPTVSSRHVVMWE